MKFRNILAGLGSLGLTLLLTGCNAAVLNPKGFIAIQERDLLFTAVGLMLIIVIPVIILTLVISRRYRASNTRAKYTPNWSHNNWLEFVWWLVPCIIIVILATITWISTHALDPYRPLDEKALGVTAKPITIQAISLRWKWLFIYPEQNIATINVLEFPVNTPVTFLITSDAPMNSFQIPQLGGQIYAMNGMQTKLHLIANTVGQYAGRSVSFSGGDFSDMFFTTTVVTDQNFDQWVQTVKHSGQTLSMDEYNQLVLPSDNNKPMFFSSVADDLFQNVIMKFMTPNMQDVDQSAQGVHL